MGAPDKEKLKKNDLDPKVKQQGAKQDDKGGDKTANQGPGQLWQRQDAKGPAPALNIDKKQESSDNKTYNAANGKMKLISLELIEATKQVRQHLGFAKSGDKQLKEESAKMIGAISSRISDRLRDTAKQLSDLRVMEDRKQFYFEEGLANFMAASDDFVAAMDDADTQFNEEFFNEGRYRVREILGALGRDKLSTQKPKPLAPVEQGADYLLDQNIEANLDAGIAAAELGKSGTFGAETRVKFHGKEVVEELTRRHAWQLPLPARIKTKVPKFLKACDQMFEQMPYMKDFVNEIIDPLRTMKLP